MQANTLPVSEVKNCDGFLAVVLITGFSSTVPALLSNATA
jgi:hypothetical protein